MRLGHMHVGTDAERSAVLMGMYNDFHLIGFSFHTIATCITSMLFTNSIRRKRVTIMIWQLLVISKIYNLIDDEIKHASVKSRVRAHARTHARTHTHTHTHTARTHTPRTHMYTHARIRTHARAHTHIRMVVCADIFWR